MRVLMFGWEFPPYQAGGLATATLGLVKGLRRNGVEVTLVVPFPTTGLSAEHGVKLVSAADRESSTTRVLIPTPLSAYGGQVHYAEALAHTRRTRAVGVPYGPDLFAEVERYGMVAARIAEREPHDVIDCHDWITFEAGLRARAVSGRPMIAHLHATERDRSGDGQNPGIREREGRGLHLADRIICNSWVMHGRIVAEYGIDPGRITVIPWGIEQARPDVPTPTPFDPGEPVVLFLGRVTHQKGPDYFLRVARRVADVLPEARFLVAGTGGMLPSIIERSVELGLAERMHFTGGLEGPDVDRAFRMAAVCVMPSVSEPFGLVALESLLSGTPCIVPRDSGVAEVLRNAFRADFWDVDRMADQVIGVLRHEALRKELRTRGLAEVQQPRFGLDEPSRRTAQVYRAALVGAGGAR